MNAIIVHAHFFNYKKEPKFINIYTLKKLKNNAKHVISWQEERIHRSSSHFLCFSLLRRRINRDSKKKKMMDCSICSAMPYILRPPRNTICGACYEGARTIITLTNKVLDNEKPTTNLVSSLNSAKVWFRVFLDEIRFRDHLPSWVARILFD